MHASVLHIDDQESTADALRRLLSADGFAVTWAQEAEDAEALVEEQRFDIILIDVWLGGRNGIELCQDLRERGVSASIAILSVANEPELRTQGLEAGADDYIAKSAPYAELRARLNALLRRNRDSVRVVRFGRYAVDVDSCEFQWRDFVLELTESEARVLAALGRVANRTVPRSRLREVLGKGQDENGRGLDNTVYRLRRKLRERTALEIDTVRGVGYRLAVEDDT